MNLNQLNICHLSNLVSIRVQFFRHNRGLFWEIMLGSVANLPQFVWQVILFVMLLQHLHFSESL